ncbi:MAG: hypothetical protein NE328_21545 [Lentisphaeraceae bacterium]|nr:hypothetical protein [Lentisphaeraceae bacterium]
MNHIKIFILAVLSIQLLSAQEFAAGTETTVPWPETVNKHLKVYLPENYSPEKKWPAIFYFHGLNGKPGTGTFQKYTDKKDFIIISMDYYFKGTQQFKSTKESQDYTIKEYNNVIAARDHLVKSISLDPKQIYLAGISKGGWITSNICETKLDDFAGAIIFLAGKLGGPKRPIKVPFKSGIPIYVGVGEFDGNFIPGVAAIEYFKPLRTQVTFEIFDGIGHAMPKETPVLFSEWLNMQRPDSSIETTEWFSTQLEAFKQTDAKALLKAYRDLRENPRLNKISKTQRTLFSSTLNQKIKDVPAFNNEIRAYLEFFKILTNETKARKPDDWEKVVNQFKKLQERYKDTEYAARSEYQIKRSTKVWEQCKAYFDKIAEQRKRMKRR